MIAVSPTTAVTEQVHANEGNDQREKKPVLCDEVHISLLRDRWVRRSFAVTAQVNAAGMPISAPGRTEPILLAYRALRGLHEIAEHNSRPDLARSRAGIGCFEAAETRQELGFFGAFVNGIGID